MTAVINLDNNYDKYELFTIDSRTEFLQLLDVLEKRTAVIEYAQSAGKNPEDPLVKVSLRFVKSKYLSSEWAAVSCGSAMIYKIHSDKAIFKRLREYESFFYNGNKRRNCYTDFGSDNDIAFFDESENLLFCTLTHEYTAFILSDLLRELSFR